MACDKKIYVAFQYHINFYHSYRGDTPDELGFGKDIRIISYTLDCLDKLNAEGIEAKGTWDIENYYSLEKLMREHCPELIERIKRRSEHGDEVQMMSYNNGMISAFDSEETKCVLKSSVSNEQKSGLADIFGTFAPVCRPQECMHTPGLEKYYKEVGIEALGMYYSAVPFTTISNFVEPLDAATRYNPFYLESGNGRKIAVIPMLNAGDIVENFGLLGCIRAVRREQMKMKKPCDMLLVFNMDADDEFWFGYLNRILSKDGKPVFDDGMYALAKSAAKLPYVEFTTPYEYMKSHKPKATVSCALDLADGSHDGYSSWAEKHENTELWSLVEQSRRYCRLAKALGADEADKALRDSLEKRILVLSTTHFGLASPVMNKTRLKRGEELAQSSLVAAKAAYDKVRKPLLKGEAKLFDFEKRAQSFSALIDIAKPIESGDCFKTENGAKLVLRNYSGEKLYALGNACELRYDGGDSIGKSGCSVGMRRGRLVLSLGNREWYINFFINHQKKKYLGQIDRTERYISEGIERLKIDGHCEFDGAISDYSYDIYISGDLPYVYADCSVRHGKTEHKGFSQAKKALLDQTYDARWLEVAPFELEAVTPLPGNPKVFKHNFLNEFSSASIDITDITRENRIDSLNNFITCGHVAFSQNGKGILIAQSCLKKTNFAFCPIRLEKDGDKTKLMLNPFGTYHGGQLKNPLAKTGLGTKAAVATCAQYDSYAPSFNGKSQEFSLMLAGFEDEAPSEKLIADAQGFAYPPQFEWGE